MQSTTNLEIDGVFEGEAALPAPQINQRLAWLRKGSLALMDQGLLSGSNFLVAILLARWLTRDEYGAYAMGFSIFILLYGFHNAFLLEPMSVFGPESYAQSLTSYVKRLLGFHFVLTSLLALAVVAGIAVLPWFKADRAMSSALWGVCISVPLVLFYWICRRTAYLKFSPGLALGGSVTYCLGVAALVFVFRNSFSPFMGFLVQALAAIPASAVLLLAIGSGRDTQPGPTNSTVLREHWRYGKWVMGSTIVTWVSGYGYYVIVGALLPMQDVAALRALRNLTEPCYRAMAAIILLVLPWASSRFAQEGRQGLRRLARQLNLMFGAGAFAYFIAVCLFRDKVMTVLYAGRYNESSHLLVLATAPLVLIAASLGSEIAVQVMQAPSEVFLAYGVSGALTLLLGVAFTRIWGLEGGLISILVSSAAVWVVLTLRCQKRLRSDPLKAERSAGIDVPSQTLCPKIEAK